VDLTDESSTRIAHAVQPFVGRVRSGRSAGVQRLIKKCSPAEGFKAMTGRESKLKAAQGAGS
jgi:hypothetical protein